MVREVGPNCEKAAGVRSAACGDAPVATADLSKLAAGTTVTIYSARVIAPPNGQCTEVENNRTIWVLLDEDADGIADVSAGLGSIPADTEAPTEPVEARLLGAEERLVLEWDATDADDVGAYQALCTIANEEDPASETSLGKSSSIDVAYVRTADYCDELDDGNTGSPLDDSEPSPTYLCAEAEAGATELSIDIAGVEADVRVRLLVIDGSGNYRVVTPSPELGRPVPAADFWEVYKEAGGQAQGGCSAGLALRLDSFDEKAAATMRGVGIQHVNLFAEITYADISGFGADHQLRLGDTTWSAGLSLDF